MGVGLGELWSIRLAGGERVLECWVGSYRVSSGQGAEGLSRCADHMLGDWNQVLKVGVEEKEGCSET